MPTAHRARGFDQSRTVLAVALLIAVVAASLTGTVAGAATQEPANPRLTPPASRLNRPEAEMPYFCGHLSFGGTFSDDQGLPGWGGAFIFRPPASADFFDFLAAWNTGLVLQADWLSLGDDGSVFSLDLVFRRYLGERGSDGVLKLPFVGAGFGISSVSPGHDESVAGFDDWSLVLEGGQEWRYARGYMLLLKVQVRALEQGGVDWSTWSVLAGFGLPYPW